MARMALENEHEPAKQIALADQGVTLVQFEYKKGRNDLTVPPFATRSTRQNLLNPLQLVAAKLELVETSHQFLNLTNPAGANEG